MKMRNLLAANLGIAVIACAALASAGSERPGDVQSRKDAVVKPKGDAQLPMADQAVPAVREIDLLPDATGHMTVGLPLIDELQPGVVVNLAVDFGRAPELFVVQARHDPTPEGSWWHLVSLERELVDATFVQRNGMFAGHVRLAAEGREVSLRPVSWNRLRVIEGDPFANHCACAGACDHEHGPGDVPDQEPMGAVAFNEA